MFERSTVLLQTGELTERYSAVVYVHADVVVF